MKIGAYSSAAVLQRAQMTRTVQLHCPVNVRLARLDSSVLVVVQSTDDHDQLKGQFHKEFCHF